MPGRNRCYFFALIGFMTISCCGDGEKLPVPPLPQNGAPLPYTQVVSRLSAQTDGAKEDLFLNRWESLAEAAVGLEHTADYILRSPDLPAPRKAVIEKTAAELKGNILKLNEAARQKDQTQSLELIRRLHNQVRELQDFR